MFGKINPQYKKLRDISGIKPYLRSINRAFYLGGFANTSADFELVEKAVCENRLNTLIANFKYNTQGDNVELYMLEDKDGQYLLIAILDFFELYHRERLLKVIPYSEKSFELLEVGNQIYP